MSPIKISNTRVPIIHIPISDFLHLLKILRCNMIKYGVVTDNKYSIAVIEESLIKYDMGKSLLDPRKNERSIPT